MTEHEQFESEKIHTVGTTIHGLLSDTDRLCALARDPDGLAMIKADADHLAAVVINLGLVLKAVQS